MRALTTQTTAFLAAAAVATTGLLLFSPGKASAATTDGPWPEPPSCSNEMLSCTSIADRLAYECFFEEEDFLIKWCDDPFEGSRAGPAESQLASGGQQVRLALGAWRH